MGRPEVAVAEYDHALALYKQHRPNDPAQKISWSQRGNCLKVLGRYEEAELSYAKALACDASFASCWSNRGANQEAWARAEAKEGRIASARQHADQTIAFTEHAIAINPKDPDYHHNLAIQQRLRDALAQRSV